MTCCGHCEDAGDFFNDKTARKDLKKYRRRGPEKSTRLLVKSILAHDVKGKKLLDIGGGIGAIQLELFKSGLQHSINVDASQAYQSVAKQEAAERGLSDQTEFYFGDFTDLASTLPDADIVTLDKVICCYPDWEKLLGKSLEKSDRIFALIFPRENLFSRIGFRLVNLWFKVRNSEFRTYLHPYKKVDAMIREHGFTESLHEKTILWRVLVYEKPEFDC